MVPGLTCTRREDHLGLSLDRYGGQWPLPSFGCQTIGTGVSGKTSGIQAGLTAYFGIILI
jgi:hypothetical protein